MRSLLDVNMLLAILDEEHLHHRTATGWLEEHIDLGWATCSLTQLATVRILSQPRYPSPLPVAAAAHALGRGLTSPAHEFWSDDAAVFGSSRIDVSRILGPAQLTDLHLLALAVGRGGRLVTFDHRITTAAVVGATAEHLVTL